MSIEIEGAEDAVQRMRELHGVDLTAEQLSELMEDWVRILQGPIQAVNDVDVNANKSWALDLATGEVREQLAPDQERARERLRRIAKETLQTLVDRYRGE